MQLEGHYTGPGTSRLEAARLSDEGNQLTLRTGSVVQHCAAEEVRFSERLSNIPRRLELPDGGCFTTPDNDGVDALLERAGIAKKSSSIDRLERRWSWALGALIALPVSLWLLFTWGMPLVAKPLAHAIPQQVVDTLDETVLKFLESQVFEASQLSDVQQGRVLALAALLDDTVKTELLFRDGQALGANALALPGGTIIFTDQLVELMEYDGELLAVMGHEVGHVAHRHGLQNLLQTVGAATVLGWVFGDLSLVTDIALVSAPTILQQMSYSRGFEEAADRYAHDVLQAKGYPVACMASAMRKLEQHLGEAHDSVPGFLLSHPRFDARIAAAEGGPDCDSR